MTRISERISQRISASLSTLKCPGCGKTIKPVVAAAEDPSGSGADADGKRWSFIWLPPRGEVCPECDFPISRYAYRRKWIHMFMLGIALLTVAALLFIFAMMSGFPGWFVWVVRVTVAAAILAALVGLAGIVVGGRHGTGPGTPRPA